MWTRFEYLYRDAANYKVWGDVFISGAIDAAQRAIIESSLQDGEYFVPEQVGLPPLQNQLGQTTPDDHCWHSFAGWDEREELPVGELTQTTAAILVERFAAVDRWRETASSILDSTALG